MHDRTIFGHGVPIFWTRIETSFGTMLVAATEQGVCRLAFGESVDALRARYPQAALTEGGAAHRSLFQAVAAAIERPGTGSDIPLDIQGTAFQQRVWAELRRIPPGQTIAYGELARRIGKPSASRAVGSANGANAIAVLIPCHRVVQADGSLGGYAYGLAIKRELLWREGARVATPDAMPDLFADTFPGA